MVATMESSLAGEVPVSLDATPEQSSSDEDGWESMPVPVDDAPESEATPQARAEANPVVSMDGEGSDERAALEAELAQLDASWEHRKEPVVEVRNEDAAPFKALCRVDR